MRLIFQNVGEKLLKYFLIIDPTLAGGKMYGSTESSRVIAPIPFPYYRYVSGNNAHSFNAIVTFLRAIKFLT